MRVVILTCVVCSLSFAVAADERDEPPLVVAQSRLGSQESRSVTYCWPHRRFHISACADGEYPNPESYLEVEHPDFLSFEIRYAERPQSVKLEILLPKPATPDPDEMTFEGEGFFEPVGERKLIATSKTRWRVDVPPREYVLFLHATWKSRLPRSATWMFGVRVTQPVDPLSETRRWLLILLAVVAIVGLSLGIAKHRSRARSAVPLVEEETTTAQEDPE